MSNVFNKLRAEYDDRDQDISVLLKSVYVLARRHRIATGQDADWIFNAVFSELKPKLKTYANSREIGLMAALLVGHGAPFRQAMLALGEWLSVGDTKIKDPYYAVCDQYDLPRNSGNLENEAFMRVAETLPIKIYWKIGKPFPVKWDKAGKAFSVSFLTSDEIMLERMNKNYERIADKR